MSDAAKEYLCASCAERRPPSLNPPGVLKEARDFNQRISMDGFEWKSQTGFQGYVIHIIDKATQFHFGHRLYRDTAKASTWKVFSECWQAWANTPQEIMMDCGGELVSEEMKNLLQQEGIKPILTAGPWQRGRVEQDGGIIKEMLYQIDNSNPIKNDREFDRPSVVSKLPSPECTVMHQRTLPRTSRSRTCHKAASIHTR